MTSDPLVVLVPSVLIASLYRSGQQWREKLREKSALQAKIAQFPDTSLLRASDASSTLQEVLVRPATTSEDDPQRLLRAAKE